MQAKCQIAAGLRLSLDAGGLGLTRTTSAGFRPQWVGFVCSAVFHLAALAALVYLPVGRIGAQGDLLLSLGRTQATRLVAPPPELAMAPGLGQGKGKLEGLTLADLMRREPLFAPRPTARQFRLPSTQVAAPPVPKPASVEAPPPELNVAPSLGTASPPDWLRVVPPPTPPPERPKSQIAFEKPRPVIELPQAGGRSVVEAKGTGAAKAPLSGEARGEFAAALGPGGRLVVGDLGPSAGITEAQVLAPRQASNLELLSNPMGVDFRPYLISVLAAVRRNWLAVIPESARLGRRGKVVIQFIINRDGYVPKLVIAIPSGSEALDRAAVAGISASNPFPPLPPEYPGNEIRLQLNFYYNMPPQ